MRSAGLLIALLAAPAAFAQPALPTTFPEGAVALAPDDLKKRIARQVFIVKPAASPEFRLQYQQDVAYFNMGSVSDEGKYRIEGSAVCIEFRRIPAGCSEMRLAGDVLYTKRYSNGEVVVMHKQ